MVARKEVCGHLTVNPGSEGSPLWTYRRSLDILQPHRHQPEGAELLVSSMELQARALLTLIH